MRTQPQNPEDRGRAGLYIHVPFCVKKCFYCDFYSSTDRAPDQVEAYVTAVKAELGRVGRPAVPLDSLYLGGGTPSLLEPRQLEGIVNRAFDCLPFEGDVETTVEVNPGTISQPFLKAFLGSGGNRVHVGVQSFDDRHLAFLGRLHSARQAREAVALVRKAGVENLGLDLIYGLPDQGRKDWLADLEAAVGFGPEHLSCYMLTFETGTPLDGLKRAGRIHPPKEERVRALFNETAAYLGERGYEQYEISNFSLGTRYRSRHNQKYWSYGPYLGLGPSAHSFIAPMRWWNHRGLDAYLESVNMGGLPIAGMEVLTKGQMMLETVFLGLRTSNGVDFAAFKARFGVDFRTRFAAVFRRIEEGGLGGMLRVNTDRCGLTDEGRVYTDTLVALFAEEIDL